MRDIALLIPAFKVPELLNVSIPSLKESITTDSEIIVILNEADQESIEILDSLKIKHIDKEQNFGPSAIDFAIPYIKEQNFKYISNINTDMLFHKGWDKKAISILKSNSPCSVSPTLVEPKPKHDPPVRICDSDLNIFEKDANFIFNERVNTGKYSTIECVACNHPITCTVEDFLAVNGYSDNMDNNWIRVLGNALDPYFAYRLNALYNGNFNFIRTNEIFVYHETSHTRRKHNVSNNSKEGQRYFKKKTGMTVSEFATKVGINA
jgi:glycosyltransferase involved in cell wall biosynthesis